MWYLSRPGLLSVSNTVIRVSKSEAGRRDKWSDGRIMGVNGVNVWWGSRLGMVRMAMQTQAFMQMVTKMDKQMVQRPSEGRLKEVVLLWRLNRWIIMKSGMWLRLEARCLRGSSHGLWLGKSLWSFPHACKTPIAWLCDRKMEGFITDCQTMSCPSKTLEESFKHFWMYLRLLIPPRMAW